MGVLVVGAVALGVIGVGWFALSTLVIGTAPGAAAAESLGVMLALLVVTSIVGSIVSARRRRANDLGVDGAESDTVRPKIDGG